jgi:hypothetical protein
MKQEITHYSHGKLHVGQITVRDVAQNNCLKLGAFARRTNNLPGPNINLKSLCKTMIMKIENNLE